MKIYRIATAILALNLSLFAADGAAIYKKCAACHGEKADVKYANKVPALASISKEERYKATKTAQTTTSAWARSCNCTPKI